LFPRKASFDAILRWRRRRQPVRGSVERYRGAEHLPAIIAGPVMTDFTGIDELGGLRRDDIFGARGAAGEGGDARAGVVARGPVARRVNVHDAPPVSVGVVSMAAVVGGGHGGGTAGRGNSGESFAARLGRDGYAPVMPKCDWARFAK